MEQVTGIGYNLANRTNRRTNNAQLIRRYATMPILQQSGVTDTLQIIPTNPPYLPDNLSLATKEQLWDWLLYWENRLSANPRHVKMVQREHRSRLRY